MMVVSLAGFAFILFVVSFFLDNIQTTCLAGYCHVAVFCYIQLSYLVI